MSNPVGLIAIDFDGKPVVDTYGMVMWFIDKEHAEEALPYRHYKLLRLVKAVKKRKKREKK